MKKIIKAFELFNNGYNCTQSIVCAYCDLFGYTMSQGYRMASGFGFGIGGQRFGCGVVSAMVIVAGMKYGDFLPSDMEKKKNLYAKAKLLNEKFIDLYSTTNCKELMEMLRSKGNNDTRPCAGFVLQGCEILEEVLDIK